MQLYILDKDPVKSAQMLPLKLRGNNYAQKMLIELGQCLSNILGNKDFDERLYKYKAVPPQFTSFIFHNQKWVLTYYNALIMKCFESYPDFKNSDTYENANKILSICIEYFYGLTEEIRINYAWFVPMKEYGERKYLPIEDCISEYKKYLEWKISA